MFKLLLRVRPCAPRAHHPSPRRYTASARTCTTAPAPAPAPSREEYANSSRLAGEANVSVPVPPSVRDFADAGAPVGAFAACARGRPYADPAWRLSQQQVEQYRTQGFVSNVQVLSPAECDAILADVTTITTPASPHPGRGLLYELHYNQSGDPSSVLAHVLGHWRLTSLLHDLVWHPALAVPTSQLLGDQHPHPHAIVQGQPMQRVRFWHDQLFCKPPHHGGNVAWHQDYSYWTRTTPMCHMTVHVALDDQTEDNGTIMFVPGSHAWHRNGMPLPITADDFGSMDSIMKVLTPVERAAFAPVPALLKRGQASFHHPLLVHGSFGNNSSHPRRAAVVNYFADGTLSDTNEELLRGVRVPKGEPMTGKYFPLVFDPACL